ncbi:MAG: hypothetical protein VX100_07880 [Pseudomonadota bacterium]|nr:hypothetical protein [Pseudomonadota bacterium]
MCEIQGHAPAQPPCHLNEQFVGCEATTSSAVRVWRCQRAVTVDEQVLSS